MNQLWLRTHTQLLKQSNSHLESRLLFSDNLFDSQGY